MNRVIKDPKILINNFLLIKKQQTYYMHGPFSN